MFSTVQPFGIPDQLKGFLFFLQFHPKAEKEREMK
jgi:hypothetical protein